jgi:hypothetical protein
MIGYKQGLHILHSDGHRELWARCGFSYDQRNIGKDVAFEPGEVQFQNIVLSAVHSHCSFAFNQVDLKRKQRRYFR